MAERACILCAAQLLYTAASNKGLRVLKNYNTVEEARIAARGPGAPRRPRRPSRCRTRGRGSRARRRAGRPGRAAPPPPRPAPWSGAGWRCSLWPAARRRTQCLTRIQTPCWSCPVVAARGTPANMACLNMHVRLRQHTSICVQNRCMACLNSLRNVPAAFASAHLEVGVVHGIAGVGERHAHCIRAVLPDGLLQRLEVACRARRSPAFMGSGITCLP